MALPIFFITSSEIGMMIGYVSKDKESSTTYPLSTVSSLDVAHEVHQENSSWHVTYFIYPFHLIHLLKIAVLR